MNNPKYKCIRYKSWTEDGKVCWGYRVVKVKKWLMDEPIGPTWYSEKEADAYYETYIKAPYWEKQYD